MTLEELAQSQRLLRKSYRRFFFFHALALAPTLAVLIVALLGSLQYRQFCHLQDHPGTNPDFDPLGRSRLHSGYQKGQCRSILDAQLLLSTLALGLVGWLASFTSRKACLAFADRIIPRLFSSPLSIFSRTRRFQLPSPEHGTSKETLIVTVAIAMQALIAESLRVLSFYWACCILVTALYLYPIQERYLHHPYLSNTIGTSTSTSVPDWAWRLSFRDPRFFVAAWSSMAWALAEFGFGAFQILHQVALYKPADIEDEQLQPSADADTSSYGRANADQSGFSLLSGRPAAHNDPEQPPERSNGKSRSMSASKALEQARQRLVQPLNAATGTRGTSQQQNYGAMGSLEEAIEENDHSAVTDGEEESSQASGSSFSTTTVSLLDQELEEEVERFLVAKERSEVEAVLGVPLPEIPVALCALWRIDAMLWSVGSSVSNNLSRLSRDGSMLINVHLLSALCHSMPRPPLRSPFVPTVVAVCVVHTRPRCTWPSLSRQVRPESPLSSSATLRRIRSDFYHSCSSAYNRFFALGHFVTVSRIRHYYLCVFTFRSRNYGCGSGQVGIAHIAGVRHLGFRNG